MSLSIFDDEIVDFLAPSKNRLVILAFSDSKLFPKTWPSRKDAEYSDAATSTTHEDRYEPVKYDNKGKKAESFSLTIVWTFHVFPRPVGKVFGQNDCAPKEQSKLCDNGCALSNILTRGCCTSAHGLKPDEDHLKDSQHPDQTCETSGNE